MFGTKVGDVFYGPSGIVVYLVYGAFSQLSGLYKSQSNDEGLYWLSCELLSKISEMIMHVLTGKACCDECDGYAEPDG